MMMVRSRVIEIQIEIDQHRCCLVAASRSHIHTHTLSQTLAYTLSQSRE